LLKIIDGKVQIIPPEGGGVVIRGGSHPTGHGGDIRLTTGAGGHSDGKLIIDIGGETVATFADDGLRVCVPQVEHLTVTHGGGELIPTVAVKRDTIVLTIESLYLEEGKRVNGLIECNEIHPDSAISVSVASNAGVPVVWTSFPEEGRVRYHISSVAGPVFDVKLTVMIKN
jgi:hypothetical protein